MEPDKFGQWWADNCMDEDRGRMLADGELSLPDDLSDTQREFMESILVTVRSDLARLRAQSRVG